MSKHKYIETPDRFEEIWELYKKKVKSNPRFSYSLSNKTGDIVAIPLELPISVDGFEVWAKKEHGDIHNYFDNTGERYNDYKAICSHIRKECRVDHLDGGMVGQYNPSITQRLNNLTERVDTTSKGEGINSITVTIVK